MSRGRTYGREILEFEMLSESSARAADEWDDVLRQWKVSSTTDGVGTTARKAHTSVRKVPGQFSTGEDFFRQAMSPAGDSPKADAIILIHIRDLRRCELWNEVAESPTIQKNDRLKRVLNRRDELIFSVAENPGLYVSQVNVWSADRSIIRFDLMGRREGPDA